MSAINAENHLKKWSAFLKRIKSPLVLNARAKIPTRKFLRLYLLDPPVLACWVPPVVVAALQEDLPEVVDNHPTVRRYFIKDMTNENTES